MANKHICDRCGKEIPDGNAFDSLADSFRRHLVVKKFYLTSMQDIDLCVDCESELFNWLETKECKCNKNQSVLELLEQLEAAEKQICEQSKRIEQLLKENQQLANGAVQQLIEKCHFRIEFNFDE